MLFAVFVFILSSKGANQWQEHNVRTLGKSQGKLFTEAAVLKCILSNYFLETCRRFSRTSEKLALENYVVAHHKADKDHAKIFPSFFVCLI